MKRVIKLWYRMHRELDESLSLEVFKNQVDVLLMNIV